MCMLWPSKAQELDGKPCQGTGGKTGRATPTWMDRVFPLQSPPAMATVCSHTMLPHLVGPLGRPTLEGNSTTN